MPTDTDDEQQQPVVVAQGDTFAVFWLDFESGLGGGSDRVRRVYGRRYDGDRALDATQVLIAEDALEPMAVELADGGFLLAWLGTDRQLRARRVDPDPMEPLGVVETLSPGAADDAGVTLTGGAPIGADDYVLGWDIRAFPRSRSTADFAPRVGVTLPGEAETLRMALAGDVEPRGLSFTPVDGALWTVWSADTTDGIRVLRSFFLPID